MKKLLASLACLSLFTLGAAPAAKAADAFPGNEPISYVVPFSAGGESDLFARLQQPYFEKALKQKVVINYKIGAGGALAWSETVKSPANGHYMVAINLPHIIAQPLTRKNAGYKTADLKPVMICHVTPCVLCVRADSPYKTLDDLVKAAKAKPGSIIMGGCGNGTSGQIASAIFNKLSGLKLPYVPFPGTADLPIALLGKHVTAIMAFTSGYSQYKNEMRPLAIASDVRDPNVDCPTFKELGYDLIEGSFRGIAVPPSTSDEIVKQLYEVADNANHDPEFIKKMQSMGMTPLYMDPAQSEAFIEQKVKDYTELLGDVNKKK